MLSLSEAIEQSRFTLAYYAKTYSPQVRRWVDGATPSKPETKKQYEDIMKAANNTKRIEYSPVWGYATPEQIERLKQPISERERANHGSNQEANAVTWKGGVSHA